MPSLDSHNYDHSYKGDDAMNSSTLPTSSTMCLSFKRYLFTLIFDLSFKRYLFTQTFNPD